MTKPKKTFQKILVIGLVSFICLMMILNTHPDVLIVKDSQSGRS